MRRLLRRTPGLVILYRHARFLADIAYERWLVNLQKMNDVSHSKREWNFDMPAVRERNAHIISAITRSCGPDPWGKALEVGCADGFFTVELARRCSLVVAGDISPIACARAAERCAQFSHVLVERLDIEHDAIRGEYDLVFAMDVLEFVHGRDRLGRVAAKLARAVRPEGLLVVSACRLPKEMRRAPWAVLFPEGADNIISFIKGRLGLRLVHEEVHPKSGGTIPGYIDHLIALFEKAQGGPC